MTVDRRREAIAGAGPAVFVQDREDGFWGDAVAETNDARRCRQVAVGARAAFIDAEDETFGVRLAVSTQLGAR